LRLLSGVDNPLLWRYCRDQEILYVTAQWQADAGYVLVCRFPDGQSRAERLGTLAVLYEYLQTLEVQLGAEGWELLPVDQRAVMVLHFYLDLPLTEAANVLDIQISPAVENRHDDVAPSLEKRGEPGRVIARSRRPAEDDLVPVGPPRRPLPAAAAALELPTEPDPRAYPVETDAVGEPLDDDGEDGESGRAAAL